MSNWDFCQSSKIQQGHEVHQGSLGPTYILEMARRGFQRAMGGEKSKDSHAF